MSPTLTGILIKDKVDQISLSLSLIGPEIATKG